MKKTGLEHKRVPLQSRPGGPWAPRAAGASTGRGACSSARDAGPRAGGLPHPPRPGGGQNPRPCVRHAAGHWGPTHGRWSHCPHSARRRQNADQSLLRCFLIWKIAFHWKTGIVLTGHVCCYFEVDECFNVSSGRRTPQTESSRPQHLAGPCCSQPPQKRRRECDRKERQGGHCRF